MTINSYDEWTQLEEVIVGRADNAIVPKSDFSVRNFMYAKLTLHEIEKLTGPYNQKIIDESNEDLENLCSELKKLKIKVHRPKIHNHHINFSTPDWISSGWANYCPRDILLVLGKNIIEVPSPMRSRLFEVHSYHDILYDAFQNECNWFSAPRPRLNDENFQFEDLSVPTLLNKEILFDAANVVRMGKDLLYQVSNSGNKKGYEWLKKMFPEYNIHLEEKAYSGAHMDSTIIPLREGLVLMNGTRVNKNKYPKIFEKWDKIFFENIIDLNSDRVGISSNSIALNLLSINENLIMVDMNQIPLMRELKKYKIESIPLNMRHSRTLGGGFHCVTLDLKRKGTFRSYFDH